MPWISIGYAIHQGVLIFSAIIIMWTQQVAAWPWKMENIANFTKCLQEVQDIEDPNEYNRLHPGFFYDPSSGLLSIDGCNQICGEGYEAWDIGDIVDRFSLWLLPALMLISHFNFAPLGISNHFRVIAHTLGDPIDSLWSILTRLEINRRLLRLSEKTFACHGQQADGNGSRESSLAEHIAVLWVTYEECGWQDVSRHLISRYKSRASTKNGGLTSSEIRHIQEASHALSLMRKSSMILTLVPVMSLGISVGIAISKTVYQYENNTVGISEFETSHTIALVSLLFIFIPLVVFSGSLGSFLTVNGPTEVLQKVTNEIGSGDSSGLFSGKVIQYCACIPGGEGEPYAAAMGYYSGIPLNSTWRPCKHILPLEQGERRLRGWWQNPNRSRCSLFGYSLSFVLLGACTPAVFLSATNESGNQMGVGCRTLSWLVISMLWIVSAFVDGLLSYLLRRRTFKLKPTWDLTVCKDSLIATAIIILAGFEQSGFYNNCWCLRAGLSSPYIDLNQFIDDGWVHARIKWGSIAPCFFLLNLGLTAWVLLVGGGRAGTASVVCKISDKLKRDGMALARESPREEDS